MGFTHRKHCSFIVPLCSTNAKLSFVFHIAKSKNNANSYNYCCDD